MRIKQIGCRRCRRKLIWHLVGIFRWCVWRSISIHRIQPRWIRETQYYTYFVDKKQQNGKPNQQNVNIFQQSRPQKQQSRSEKQQSGNLRNNKVFLASYMVLILWLVYHVFRQIYLKEIGTDGGLPWFFFLIWNILHHGWSNFGKSEGK